MVRGIGLRSEVVVTAALSSLHTSVSFWFPSGMEEMLWEVRDSFWPKWLIVMPPLLCFKVYSSVTLEQESPRCPS